MLNCSLLNQSTSGNRKCASASHMKSARVEGFKHPPKVWSQIGEFSQADPGRGKIPETKSTNIPGPRYSNQHQPRLATTTRATKQVQATRQQHESNRHTLHPRLNRCSSKLAAVGEEVHDGQAIWIICGPKGLQFHQEPHHQAAGPTRFTAMRYISRAGSRTGRSTSP